jgi:hypothetical protein
MKPISLGEIRKRLDLKTRDRLMTKMIHRTVYGVGEWRLDLRSAGSCVFQRIVVKKIPTDLTFSEAISYQKPFSRCYCFLSVLHDGGYLMVYPRPSRQASIAR